MPNPAPAGRTAAWLALLVVSSLALHARLPLGHWARVVRVEVPGALPGLGVAAVLVTLGLAWWRGPALVLRLAAGAAGLLAILAWASGDRIDALVGPPPLQLREAYADAPVDARFDHGDLDALLRRFVDDGGRVDYAAWSADASARESLARYVERLAGAPVDRLGRDGLLALYINAYNACTIALMLEHWPIGSIMDLPAERRWADRRWEVGGRTRSLDDIEHDELRRRFIEPRIHWAVSCASVGCPPLRAEAIVPERLEAQLEDQARRTHADERWLVVGETVGLTRIYLWYGGDFTQTAGSALAHAARYSAPLRALLEESPSPAVRWLDYDWSINAADPP